MAETPGSTKGGELRSGSFAKLPHLRARSDFVRVQSKGRRFRKQHMVLLVAPGLAERARIGITVSRKVGNAVVRNRVRRRIREILRTHPQLLCPDRDHVVVAFPRAAQADYATLEEELTWLLGRARSALSNAAAPSSGGPNV